MVKFRLLNIPRKMEVDLVYSLRRRSAPREDSADGRGMCLSFYKDESFYA